jgi:NAD/NADP transhydrogenase beta subunit
MKNRVNVLIVVAMVIFIVAAKYLTRYEPAINEFGFWLVGLIILMLCALTFSIEFLIYKTYIKFKNKGS